MKEAIFEGLYVFGTFGAMFGVPYIISKFNKPAKKERMAKIEGVEWDMNIMKHWCDDMFPVKDISKQNVVIKGVFAQKN